MCFFTDKLLTNFAKQIDIGIRFFQISEVTFLGNVVWALCINLIGVS